jgi:N-acyl-phosphatidylethanolamine-hydrolysing phospholipase D
VKKIMQNRMKPTKFRNLHPHSPHNFAGVVRWKLGFSPDKPDSILPPNLRNELPVSSLALLSASPDRGQIRLTWIGHSTFLMQHHGLNILTDPIFGDCQPLPIGRMRRSTEPGIRLEDLPPIHHVLISHSHYDHLDAPAIRALQRRANQSKSPSNGIQFWVPEGLASWFRKRGIAKCHEIPWGQSARLTDGIHIHSVPAQHGSARTLFDRNRSHWCGWVLQSPERTAYFAGDTGYAPIFRDIGARFGGFDLSLIPIGCYNPRWLMQPVHLNPVEAVQVHLDVQSRLSVACHWGTFRLADEPLNEPPALLAQALASHHIDASRFLALQPGHAIDV